MKILLINPPASLKETWGELAEVGNEQQPLGIAYIAAVLENEGHEVQIIDAPPLKYSIEDIVRVVCRLRPDIIGITSVTLTFPTAIKLASRIKEEANVPTVIGGAHVTAVPEETIRHNCFNFGVIGEGELTIVELIKAIEKGNTSRLDSVKGIVFRKGKEVVVTAPRPYIKNLESLPFPARHLLPPLDIYHPTPASYKNLPLGTLITSRGCPYRCTYCAKAVFGRKFRAMPAKNVVDEIELLVNKYGAKEVRLQDDTFNVLPRRVADICSGMSKRQIKVPWTCIARLNNMRYETLQTMEKAKCWQISYGIESGDQQILDHLNRDSILTEDAKTIRATKQAGISTRGFFMLGLPGDTEETMAKTIEFAKSLELDVAHFSVFTPFPGSELFSSLKAEGKLKQISYDKYTPFSPVQIAYSPDGLKADTILRYQRRAYQEFYLRPRFIWKQALTIRSFSDIARYLKAFLTIRSMDK